MITLDTLRAALRRISREDVPANVYLTADDAARAGLDQADRIEGVPLHHPCEVSMVVGAYGTCVLL